MLHSLYTRTVRETGGGSKLSTLGSLLLLATQGRRAIVLLGKPTEPLDVLVTLPWLFEPPGTLHGLPEPPERLLLRRLRLPLTENERARYRGQV